MFSCPSIPIFCVLRPWPMVMCFNRSEFPRPTHHPYCQHSAAKRHGSMGLEQTCYHEHRFSQAHSHTYIQADTTLFVKHVGISVVYFSCFAVGRFIQEVLVWAVGQPLPVPLAQSTVPPPTKPSQTLWTHSLILATWGEALEVRCW